MHLFFIENTMFWICQVHLFQISSLIYVDISSVILISLVLNLVHLCVSKFTIKTTTPFPNPPKTPTNLSPRSFRCPSPRSPCGTWTRCLFIPRNGTWKTSSRDWSIPGGIFVENRWGKTRCMVYRYTLPPKCISMYGIPSLKLTVLHLKMDGWNTVFPFGDGGFFQGRTVSFRECIDQHLPVGVPIFHPQLDSVSYTL